MSNINENLKEIKLHDDLKNFLLEVGKKEGYKSFSGDSECLDIRLKKRHTEYKPDVVWKSKTSCHVFEFAFTEDWRAIVGEFTLAWLAGCSSFSVFRLVKIQESDSASVKVVTMPTKKETREPLYRSLFGILGEKYSMKWYYNQITTGSNWSAKSHKQTVLWFLKRGHFITKESYLNLHEYFWNMKLDKNSDW